MDLISDIGLRFPLIMEKIFEKLSERGEIIGGRKNDLGKFLKHLF